MTRTEGERAPRWALALAGLALVALAAGVAGHLLRPAPLSLSEHRSLPGFLRLEGAGEASAGGAVATLLGQVADEAPAPPITAPGAVCAALWSLPGAPAVGPADAGARIAVFSDANCPYCRRLDEILGELAADRPDLRIVWHEWPVLGPGSVVAARAALAAREQGAFKTLHARLLRSRFLATPEYVRAVAEAEGLDPDRLAADMASPSVSRTLAASDALARAFGMRGTPTLVVEGAMAEGALDRARIEALLEAEAAREGRPCR